MDIHLERVVDSNTLEQYRALTARHVGVLFPNEYLEAGDVYVMYDAVDNMVGGYALILEPPFRAIQSIPTSKRWKALNAVSQAGDSVCELNGLWLASEHRTPRAGLVLWRHLRQAVVARGRRAVVYAYGLEKPHLSRLYSAFAPEVLYQGETVTLEGMAGPEPESIEMVTVSRAAEVLPLHHSRVFVPRLEPAAAMACMGGGCKSV